MNGWAEHQGRDGATQAGRHRAGGTEGWTPAVPPRRQRPTGHGHHAHREFAPPSTGSLPLPPPRDRRAPSPGYAPSSGRLPLPQPAREVPARVEVSFTEPATTGERTAKVAQRTKVTLTAPAPRRPEPVEVDDTDDVRVYLAPPVDGLSTFDLGTVPASVTPPKTWRKAAWFAAAASALVVVGLLFAGSYLVGKPLPEQQSQGGWPGYRGGSPLTQDGVAGHPATPPQGGAAGNPSESETESTTGDDRSSVNSGTPSDSETAGTDSSRPGSSSGPVTSGRPAPSSSDRPQKPPVVPANRTTTPGPWYASQPDAEAMGDNTEIFLNTVTTNPQEASSVTSGGLREEGAEGLRDRYRDVAYFEVKKVSIDQRRGVTVNTVEVTHKDGTKTMEQRTFTFGDDDKIVDDGM
ncbi:hypothetical protein NQK81_18935 [Amycolatopsis roodepoortensis]|uniref:hypothetical protein n=1 Tax=Amycolatopsis roodepoortensis TaxID=700274 RepID=UPI00214C485D|nr:hypothetical protein [Amycolatopsis roodepoortensis]UUV35428.1 hypothetical protein NQK81_18935 [Amycolatopsis roodepoortensis]